MRRSGDEEDLPAQSSTPSNVLTTKERAPSMRSNRSCNTDDKLEDILCSSFLLSLTFFTTSIQD